MTYGEEIINGATYYWCHPDLPKADSPDMEALKIHRTKWGFQPQKAFAKAIWLWVTEYYGEPVPYATVRPRKWFAKEQKFYFLDPGDRMAMVLRWS